MLKNICALGLSAGLFWTTAFYARAIPSMFFEGQLPWQKVQFILPDEQFVSTECRELTKFAVRYAPSDVDQVSAICTALKKGEISPDEWVSQIDPVARKIDEAYDCPNCERRFLAKREPVPIGFSTYVLALLPSKLESPDWRWQFRKQFDTFGSSIGNKKLAVWLGTRYGDYLDDDRNKYYCDKFDLSYNDGPYLVVTRVRPDLFRKGDEVIFVKLGGIDKDRILRVLNILEQDLRKEQEVRKRALIFEEVKQRLLSAARRNTQELKDVAISWLKK